MKQVNANLLSLKLKSSLLLAMFIIGVSYVSLAQVYTATLSGPNESPANASPGTGTATVTINGTTMRVQVTFSGLLATTTASHIHAATPVPLTGTAGVATTTPTFAGFPLGVTAGSMDQTYNMTLASSYNPAYITANGGSPTSAFTALKAALNNHSAYLNIHTTLFPAGEIRGFLNVVCPTITVTIPDAYALPHGVLANTVYPAYAPASSLMLTSSASGGTGPYTYSWSNGSTDASTTVSPTTPTQYTVNVLDQGGCPGTATKIIQVANVASGRKGDKIAICHKEKNTLSIDASSVPDHLGHGDMLGSCAGSPSITVNGMVLEEQANVLRVSALPNPSMNYFDIKLGGEAGSNIQVRVYDFLGRVIETKAALQPNQTLRLGAFYNPGIYVVEVSQNGQKQTLKLVKGK